MKRYRPKFRHAPPILNVGLYWLRWAQQNVPFKVYAKDGESVGIPPEAAGWRYIQFVHRFEAKLTGGSIYAGAAKYVEPPPL